MVNKRELEKTIITALNNVVKKNPNAAFMKKKDLLILISEEPGPKIGDIYSIYSINRVIRNYFKNEHNKVGR